jgi:membrane-associated protease RseP (regulator of RpoE activity)
MCNVGGIDRSIRIIVGVFLISLVFVGDQLIGQNVVWGWIGVVPLATGIFKFCPAYTLLGIKTCKAK